MARIEYGHTWWGRRWLESLTHIDYENRLPRGKRYARNATRYVNHLDLQEEPLADSAGAGASAAGSLTS